MNTTPDHDETKQPESQNHSWGSKLFIAVLSAILAFFYWLLIYSGGVSVHHG
ncbi:MAG: hypothetical protein KZQ99_10565 [Candidatus Thiodiazotropha sp. (ex Dulcina madagascariensis)]|nr:hypothetical protein [Candidatus Thiodiazotropha sp. (ex Epidulcina cf. delphinae)]MCU7921280.1 hypothetical protein [Candidatus Thiodiazotropha sp. (ex Dulcina madagascariensis)]MCU7926931.1 hypothetical protein [Candidatus Thiodiazotropha sp. (ex Dulcina madagascariensis)]MCU7935308.1 hypothetical protein [Candidatus Thiodiazotropha sp. (ex Dulcina madagascariensis)]